MLSAHSSAPYTATEIGPADILEIVFTSGTTAELKGVVITHGNVLGNIAPLEMEKYERLANYLAIPVVPMRIDGLFELKKAKKKFAIPGTIKVKIGSPVRFPPNSPPERIAAELQKVVETL